MVRCLMLDVDGVVVTGRPEDGRSWATDIERDLGIAPDALAESLPALSPSLAAQDFIDYWFSKDARIDEAVLAACDTLRGRGVQVFLATNQEHLRAAYLMDRLALRNHVDGIVYSAEIAARKPDRAFFAAAEKRSGAAPRDILLVDDTKANIDAARDAGWQAMHWTAGSSPETLLDMDRR